MINHQPAWTRRQKRGRWIKRIAVRFISEGSPSHDAVLRYAERVAHHGAGVL